MSTARYNKVPIQSEEPEYIDGDDHERNDDPSSNTQERETTSDPSTVENTTTNVTAVTTTTTTSTSEKESNNLLNEVSATSNTNTITVDDAIGMFFSSFCLCAYISFPYLLLFCLCAFNLLFFLV